MDVSPCRTTPSSSTTSGSRSSPRRAPSSIAARRPATTSSCKGEMLHLPPGQGFSIYSLAALLPLLPAKQRATHPNDWMSTDAEVACPDPNCPTPLPHHAAWASAASATRATDGRARCQDSAKTDERRDHRAAPGLPDLARHPRRLAARRRPRGDRGRAGDRRHGRLRRRRHHDLRLRRHLHRRRGDDRRFRARILASRGADALRAFKVHTKFVPDWDALPRVDRAYVRAHHRPLAAAARDGAPRPGAVPLVGLRRARLPSRPRLVSRSCGARARSTISAAPTSTPPTRERPARRRRAARLACRCSTRCSTGGPRTASPASPGSAA